MKNLSNGRSCAHNWRRLYRIRCFKRDARLDDTPKNRLKVILDDKYTMQIIWEQEDALVRRNREAAIGRARILASLYVKTAAAAAQRTCEGLFR